MKLLTIISTLFIVQYSFSQISLTKLDNTSVPKEIHYKGKLVQAVSWTDSTGENLMVLSLTDEFVSETAEYEDRRSKQLFARHYYGADTGWKNDWTVSDKVSDCSVDITLHFLKNTFAVTDLNADGNGEVWMMYKVSCQGDVSPVPMKIIMYEDNKKFAVRGVNRVDVGNGKHMGGEYTMDEAFKNGPAEFRKYAEKLWKAHKNDGWGE